MSLSKIVLVGAVSLLGIIGIAGAVKNFKAPAVKPAVTAAPSPVVPPPKATPVEPPLVQLEGDLPPIDRIHQLFTTKSTKLPIVETVTYSSSVSWLKGRPAWIADYATHYATSRHFIARSLNGKPDYDTQRISPGRQFNVFRKDKKHFQFHLLASIAHCKMGLYYVDLDTNERVLLKTYKVALGKIGEKGSLTPLGKYKLGSRIAVYRPGVMGLYHDKQIELIRIFGTRWIPLESVEENIPSPKGLGINGVPWRPASKSEWVEQKEILGKYETDGCLALATEDVEELFSIVITKPTVLEIVKHFKDAKLPGVEVATPLR